MVEILGLSNPKIVESNLDRANIYCASHTRSDKGDEKLDSILEPIVAELKAYKVNMPITLIYGSLETISDCFLYFSTKKGEDQFYLPNAEPLAKNRLLPNIMLNIPKVNALGLWRNWCRGLQPIMFFLQPLLLN